VPCVYDTVRPSVNQLSRLHVDLPIHGSWDTTLVPFFNSAHLVSLEVLSIGQGRDSRPLSLSFYRGLERVLHIVTGKIGTLKELELNSLVELSWIKYFSRLTNLKVLRLKIRTVLQMGDNIWGAEPNPKEYGFLVSFVKRKLEEDSRSWVNKPKFFQASSPQLFHCFRPSILYPFFLSFVQPACFLIEG
jgi:hypothetical protein